MICSLLIGIVPAEVLSVDSEESSNRLKIIILQKPKISTPLDTREQKRHDVVFPVMT